MSFVAPVCPIGAVKGLGVLVRYRSGAMNIMRCRPRPMARIAGIDIGSRLCRSLSTTDTEGEQERRESEVGPGRRNVDPDKPMKRRVALVIGYVGSGYSGSQMQLGGADVGPTTSNTIESQMFRALVETGLILPHNSTSEKKVGWKRGSRTDKGVHALMNVLSLKIQRRPSEFLSDASYEGAIGMLNEALPGDIRVLHMAQARGSFHPRNYCSERIYDYYLPVSTLGTQKTTEAGIQDLQKAMSQYIGTGFYHNLTRWERPPAVVQQAVTFLSSPRPQGVDGNMIDNGIEGEGATSMTYGYARRMVEKHYGKMRRLIGDINVYPVPECMTKGVPVVRVELRGQSFIYHQIRKMIGAAICVVRGVHRDTYLRDLLTRTPWRDPGVPLAPGSTLVLRDMTFPHHQKDPHITLSRDAIGRQGEFATNHLLPHIGTLLRNDAGAPLEHSFDEFLSVVASQSEGDQEWLGHSPCVPMFTVRARGKDRNDPPS